jgi:hypothetical protein
VNVLNKINKKCNPFFRRATAVSQNSDLPTMLRLHLGCGSNYLEGWINIDISDRYKVDMRMNFQDIKNHFQVNTVTEIMMIHSISYLRLWEARDFFAEVYSVLQTGGKFTLEFPDVVKCVKVIAKEKEYDAYIEGIRALYAFDMSQIKKKNEYQPYAFGWSAWHIITELQKVGFSSIVVKDPQTHGHLVWRDTRVESIK